jgi:8-amino-7-oxononanoate synthase
LAGNKDFQQILLKKINENPELLKGSTGSRLISGNSLTVAETEEYIAKEHQYESALLFLQDIMPILLFFNASDPS